MVKRLALLLLLALPVALTFRRVQLQRIGLVPNVRVEPTIEGIREGKDEVLARAIAFINSGK